MSYPFLAAFRKVYGCQTTLLRLLEDWRSTLDKHEYLVAILMDLSKTFDCLPHNLLLAKLQVYGVSSDAVKIIDSYLSVVPCGGRTKVSPHSSIVQIIFYFWSFEIMEYILRTQKLS